MTAVEALKRLSAMDRLTLASCVHYCATLNKKDRAYFQKMYGTKTDAHITELMQQLYYNKK